MPNLKDNTTNKYVQVTPEELMDLKEISWIPLDEIVADNPHVLVFPPNGLNNTKDKIGDSCVVGITANGCIKTTNLIGFIGVGQTQISIHSRFDQTDKDYFLMYLLNSLYNINIFNFPHGEDRNDKLLDLLIMLFPSYLNSALKQGVYREYRSFNRNDAAVKGTIDIPRHISKNIPFAGKIAYHSREYSYDNDVTQLIRHTIEFIKTRPFGVAVLSSSQIRIDIGKIYEATTSYNRQHRNRIIMCNQRGKKHPYYTAYYPLINICLAILKYERIAYAHSDTRIYGILFDVSWLWEEYIWSLIRETSIGFNHPKSKEHKGSIVPFESGKIGRFMPDYYVEKKIVLDAKYKPFGENPQGNKYPHSDDLQQVISYMHILDCDIGGFVFPDSISSIDDYNVTELGKLRGKGGFMYQIGFPIPPSNLDYKHFSDTMKIIEAAFKENIETLIAFSDVIIEIER